jgi:hypothetical protein
VTDQRATFIVRLTRDQGGQITGVVERVRTGEKASVATLAEVGAVLAEMLAREVIEPESANMPSRRKWQ